MSGTGARSARGLDPAQGRSRRARGVRGWVRGARATRPAGLMTRIGGLPANARGEDAAVKRSGSGIAPSSSRGVGRGTASVSCRRGSDCPTRLPRGGSGGSDSPAKAAVTSTKLSMLALSAMRTRATPRPRRHRQLSLGLREPPKSPSLRRKPGPAPGEGAIAGGQSLPAMARCATSRARRIAAGAVTLAPGRTGRVTASGEVR